MLRYPGTHEVTAVRMMEAISQFVVLAQMAPSEVLDLISHKVEQCKEDGPAEERFLSEAQRFLKTLKEENAIPFG